MNRTLVRVDLIIVNKLGGVGLSSVTIVIPVINEAAQIQQSIARAWASGCDELVIVDGGSHDGTQAICQNERCVFLEAQGGRGPQLNAGAEVATSDFLLFLHADNWLVENGCQQLTDFAETAAVDYGGFRQRIENEGWSYRWIERGNGWRILWRKQIYGDQAFFIRREIFESLGGFPPIPLMEDLAFSMTLKKKSRQEKWQMRLLEGPTMVAARRWEHYGVVRQTLKNWMLSTAFLLGASPQWLARQYRRHDQHG